MTRPPLESPYPGLRPFKKQEWPIFFGREPMIDAVVDRLAATQLVVVHGGSGCGKSSLIRAGVLPRLEQEHSHYGVPWRTAEMRPGSSPLWNLATAIARLVEKLDGADEPTLANTRTIRRLLNGGSNALRRIQDRFELGREGNVCILLDQFEELFRYSREIGREEAETLIEVLRGFERRLGGGHPELPRGIHGILTLRSDHLGDCAHFQGFAELVNATQYLLPRIRDEGDKALLRAIREPARLFGGEVSVELAVRLINESRDEIDALPLIQHALMYLWRRAERSSVGASRSQSNPCRGPRPVLTADTYDGLEELLSEHAEEVLREIATARAANEKVTEYLFRAIAEIDVEGRYIRRPRRRSQLLGVTGGDEAALERVIDRFCQTDCGFLVRSHGDDPIIDIGHEALIRCWKKLDDPTIDRKTGRARGWLQREREDERIWRSMLVQAEAGDRISSAVLKDRRAWFHALPGPMWAERYGGGWERIEKLLASSRRAAWGKIASIAGALAVVLVSATVLFSSWILGVTPVEGMMLLALREGVLPTGRKMLELEGGTFMMGSPEDESGRHPDEGPQHEVNVAPFAIGKREVTFDEWNLCVADGGCPQVDDEGWGRGRRPVINVTQRDAQAYVDWLSRVTGEPYRLPSEAEWEYAARAGTTTRYSWGDHDPTPEQGNISVTGKTTEVGSYPANPWGLYDMQGNVWEWMDDCWNDSYEGAPTDGSAWTTGECDRRVLRGGPFYLKPAAELRTAYRLWGHADSRYERVGFRVAKTLSPSVSANP